MARSHKRDAMPLILILMLPLAEIATFILVGKAIGLLATLALVVASSALGMVMLRDVGVMTVLKLQRQKADPALVLAEGGSRMLAALLLLIPGFLTDLAAIMILASGSRAPLLNRFGGAATAGRPRPPSAPEIIDGDFRRLDEPL